VGALLLNYPSRFEAYGSVEIYELSRIHTLLSMGISPRPGAYSIPSLKQFEDVASRTVFIVPVKNEDPFVLEGVLRAIPYYSQVILVSNSQREPLNMYKVELDIARTIFKNTGRTIIILHQKDKVLADNLAPHLPSIIGEDSLVKDGKGEGMLIGAIIADALGAENIAFVDADNYIPSVVLEYALIYYTTLSMSESKYKMARIYWGYKAWMSPDELYYRRMGRASSIVNALFNKVLSYRRRVETDIIKTSNSGEHAMSMDLAREIVYGGGFSVETQELVSILEKCYLGVERGLCPSLHGGIEIYQVESLSPHIHAEKGEAHVLEMIFESASALYHSEIAEERGKSFILKTLGDLGFSRDPVQISRYEYPKIDARKLMDTVLTESSSSTGFGV
jgi:mannosyl-3-phosphoglycerate synthase